MTAAILALAVTLAGPAAQVPLAPPRIGPANPAHLIALYADLTSPAAARAFIVLTALRERYSATVALEFHHLAPSGDARIVDRAVVAAEQQGQGWHMAHLILENPDLHTRNDLVAIARQLQLDVDVFAAALQSADRDSVIAADAAVAADRKFPLGVAVLVDGQIVTGPITLDALDPRVR